MLSDTAFEAECKRHPKSSSSNGNEDMAYQNEVAVEAQLVEQLNSQDHSSVSIPNYNALLANCKITFETCQDMGCAVCR